MCIHPSHSFIICIMSSLQQPIPPNSTLATTASSNQSGSNDFVKKLFLMLQEDSYKEVVRWTASGDSFVVINTNEFTKDILPRHFKHSNFASFVRQLNKYDFHKVKIPNEAKATYPYGDDAWEFKHPDFRINDIEALENIKRKGPTGKKTAAGSTTPSAKAESSNNGAQAACNHNYTQLSASNNYLKEQVENLKKENNSLHQEVNLLDRKYKTVVENIVAVNTFNERYHRSISILINTLLQSGIKLPPLDFPPPAQLGPDSGLPTGLSSMSDTTLPSISQHLQSPLQHHTQLMNRSIRPITSPVGSVKPLPLVQHAVVHPPPPHQSGPQPTTGVSAAAPPPPPPGPIPLQSLVTTPGGSVNVPVAVPVSGPQTLGPLPPPPPPQPQTQPQPQTVAPPTTQPQPQPPQSSQGAPVVTPLLQQHAGSASNVPTISPKSPAISMSTSASPNTSAQINTTTVPNPKFHVLLVEDDNVCIQLCRKFLVKYGCLVTVVTDGLNAISTVEHTKYDLVLMDIVMPNLDGATATSVIRSFDTKTPIIAMTGNIGDNDLVTYLQNGMSDILAKPFTKDDLYAILAKHLLEPKELKQEDQEQQPGIKKPRLT